MSNYAERFEKWWNEEGKLVYDEIDWKVGETCPQSGIYLEVKGKMYILKRRDL